MKSLTLLPLLGFATAFILPDEAMVAQIQSANEPQSFLERIKQSVDIDAVWMSVEETFEHAEVISTNAIDAAINAITASDNEENGVFQCSHSMSKVDIGSWLSDNVPEIDFDGKPHHPHHPPPHHKPKHPHHSHKPNKTIYELISSSKYTTKLAALVDEYPDLVEVLNGTAANYTLFAPTDKAFEKIPKGHKKPSKELIKKVLAYHLSPEFYPAGRVLVTHTIPTALGEDALGGAQRLRVGLGLFKGLTLNFYSKVVAINIFATNGVIHGVDSLLLPPPPALKIIGVLPGEFSTLQLGLYKTGLFEAIEKSNHTGGTLFAPSNFAFKKLGPKINAFLFSSYGEKYLKALLKYHIVANQTLYSDAYYGSSSEDEVEEKDIPKGHFHVDLQTLLEDKSLSIDVARYGGIIDIKINGFSRVAVQDGIAKDGVIHVIGNVLIPPKTPGAAAEEATEEMEVEELMDRLIPEGRIDL